MKKLKDILLESPFSLGPSSADVWGGDMVRSLNSLANDINDQKYDKQMAWAAKNERQAREVSEMAEQLKELIIKMGASIKLKNKKIYNGEKIADIFIKSKKNLNSINCPPEINSAAIDEFLIIFLVAAKAKGISRFRDLGEMNKKESKRLDLATKFLKLIGIKVERFKDNINIHGNPNLILKDSYEIKNFLKDHRIFFLSCIAALTLGGKWKIHDKDSINTSFPNFLKTLNMVGAKFKC